MKLLKWIGNRMLEVLTMILILLAFILIVISIGEGRI